MHRYIQKRAKDSSPSHSSTGLACFKAFDADFKGISLTIFSHIPAFAFITTGRKLKEIFLAGNGVTSIDARALAGLPALKILDLSENAIHCLMPGSLAGCPLAMGPTEDSPLLAELGTRFEMDLEALSRVDLRGNRWRCDCDLKPLLQNATALRIMPQLRLERCESPPSFRRRYLSAAASRMHDCD